MPLNTFGSPENPASFFFYIVHESELILSKQWNEAGLEVGSNWCMLLFIEISRTREKFLFSFLKNPTGFYLTQNTIRLQE